MAAYVDEKHRDVDTRASMNVSYKKGSNVERGINGQTDALIPRCSAPLRRCPLRRLGRPRGVSEDYGLLARLTMRHDLAPSNYC
eukprot:1185180-Prorocentrum_minimum.AAC.1